MIGQNQQLPVKYLAFWLGLLLFSLYWLAFSGRVYLSPGMVIKSGPFFGNMLVVALSAAILLLWLVDMGQSRAVSAGVTLAYGLTVWIMGLPYLAGFLPALILALLTFFWAGQRARKSKKTIWAGLSLFALIMAGLLFAGLLKTGFPGGWFAWDAPFWRLEGNAWLILPPLIVLGMALLNVRSVYRGGSRGYPPPLITILITLLLTVQFFFAAAHSLRSQIPLSALATMQTQIEPGDILLVLDADPLETAAILTTKPYTLPAVFAYTPKLLHSNWKRIWALELNSQDKPGYEALNQAAFWLGEQKIDPGGKLALFVLSEFDAPFTPLDIPFEENVVLQGFALSNGPLRPGDTLTLQLNGLANSSAQLTAFVQLLPETDPARIIAQQDRPLPSQTASFTHRLGLALPADMSPGNYLVIVGFYHAQSGQRLSRADGSPDDFLYLTTVQVVE